VIQDVVKKVAWVGKRGRGTHRFVPQALEALGCDRFSAPVDSPYNKLLDVSLKNHRLRRREYDADILDNVRRD
jgi:hypothetical protein